MKKLLSYFTIFEWVLWICSIGCVAVFTIIFGSRILYLIGAVIGVTALLLNAKGNPAGQVLTVVFSVFYGIISFSFAYYGEMITYLGMSAPIAVASVVTWLRNPHAGNRGEVKVNELKAKEYILSSLLGIAVTAAFYFILAALETSNLLLSTISVFTSFIAAYLTMRRSRFYAVAYALNDIVLVALWILASIDDPSYIVMIVCFAAFLISDIYGFISWSVMHRRQKNGQIVKQIKSVAESGD